MRIVTWNCCQGFAAKYPWLLSLDFDVAVVPECAPLAVGLDQARKLSSVIRRMPSGGSKHLGVFAQEPWALEEIWLPEAAGMPWVVPVRVTGPLTFTLLAIWTQSVPRPYTSQTHRVVTEVLPAVAGPVVIAGDLNAPGRHGSQQLKAHLATVDALRDAGMVSAFAAARGVEPSDAHMDGPEGRLSLALREPTYFHRRRQDDQWHIDHMFLPADWAHGIDTSVGSYDEWVATGRSDHVPLVVDLTLP